MLNRTPIAKNWENRRISAYSHIARLPYKNPARIALFGHRVYEKKINVKKRKFWNVKSTMMKDINKILNQENYCELCNKKIRLSAKKNYEIG